MVMIHDTRKHEFNWFPFWRALGALLYTMCVPISLDVLHGIYMENLHTYHIIIKNEFCNKNKMLDISRTERIILHLQKLKDNELVF